MSSKERKYKSLIENKVFFMKQLDNLSLNRKYMGYYYIVEIMELLINQGKNIKSFSKEVYPIIAKKYAKKECTIERNIRSLISKSWSFELMTKLKIFYPNNKKPSCRKFINLVKEFIFSQIL